MESPVLLDHSAESSGEDKIYCRILHLSDLHFSVNTPDNGFQSFCYGTNAPNTVIKSDLTDVDELLHNYGLRGYLKLHPVDCIVITGDFSHRGQFSESNLQFIRERLIELYRICAQAGHWTVDGRTWDKQSTRLPMDRLFYCAGNHDLLRDASCYNKSIGKYVTRQDVVRDLVKKQKTAGGSGCLETDDTGKNLLTVSTFGPFYEMLESLRMGPEGRPETYNYEGTLFCLKAHTGTKEPDICFAAINTALLAGNVDSVDQDLFQKIWQRLQTSVDIQEKCNAAKEYYEQLGKLTGEKVDDDGALCMPSQNVLDTIYANIQDHSRYIGIMLGHHNQELFCKNAQKAFDQFVGKCGIQIYLCGHTHRPDDNCIATDPVYSKNGNLQIRVASSAFYDKKDYYNTFGFSIHTISRSENDSYYCESKNIIFYRLLEKWMQKNAGPPEMQNRFKVCVSTIEPSLGIDTGNTTLSPKDAPQFSLSDELEESTNPLANDRNAGEKMMKINDYDARSKADKELQGKECLVKEIEQNNAINEGILAEKNISAKYRNITLPDDTLTPTNRRRRSK